jgi:drug/metabolite transporter (DMT)-like permease
MRIRVVDLFLLFLMCAIWAGNYFVVDGILPYIDPITLSFLRAGLGGLFVLAIGGYSMRGLGRSDLGWCVLFAVFNTALFLILLNASLLTANAGVDSTLVYTQPIMVVAFAPLLGERLTYRRVVGMLAAFAGVAVVFLPSLLGASVVVGDVYAIGAAFSWALAVLVFKKWDSKADARAIMSAQSLIGAALIIPAFAFQKPFIDPTLPFWVFLLYSVVLASGLTYVFFLRMLSKMPATQFTSYLFLVPVLATIMASLLQLSIPPTNEILGTALVALGIVIVNR